MKMNKNIISSITIFIAIFYKYLSFYEIVSEEISIAIVFIAIILNIIIIIKRKFNRKQLITILVPFIFITILSGSIDFVITLLLSLMFYKDNIKDFFRNYFISSAFCYVLTIFLNFIGVLENNAIRRITEEGIIVRNSLGFSHVNGVFKNLMPIILSGYFLVKEKNIKKYNIVVFVLSTILFAVSNSRTGYICVIIYLLFTSFINIMKHKIVRKSIKYMYIICTIITILITNVAGRSFDNSINQLLSDRPVIWNYYLYNAGVISLINFNFTRIPIDNTYITYIINYGILTYVILFLIKYFAIKKINDNRILLIILIISIYGIFENLTSYGLDFTLIIQLIYLLDIKNNDSNELKQRSIQNELLKNERE